MAGKLGGGGRGFRATGTFDSTHVICSSLFLLGRMFDFSE
jgi:hypothetical protein